MGLALQHFSQLADAAIWASGLTLGGGSLVAWWILDPLDGTANYIFGVPRLGISVAREEQGRIVAGHVYDAIGVGGLHRTEERRRELRRGTVGPVDLATPGD